MWVQTVVAVTTASALLIPANPKRLRMRLQVTGTGACTIAPGAVTVTAGQGFVLTNAMPPQDFVLDCDQNAYSVIGAAASTVVVWEFLPGGSIPGPGNSGANLTSSP